jgi:hypothetical protein
MLKNFNIRTILVLGFTLVLLLVTLINIPLAINTVTSVVEQAEERELKKLISRYKADLKKLPPSGQFIRNVDGRLYLYRTHSKKGKIK